MVVCDLSRDAEVARRIIAVERATVGTDRFEARGALLVASVLWGRGCDSAARQAIRRAERALGWL